MTVLDFWFPFISTFVVVVVFFVTCYSFFFVKDNVKRTFRYKINKNFMKSIVVLLYFIYLRQAKMLLTQPEVYPQRTLISPMLHIRKSLINI